jgi:hypothetical protein
MSLHCPPPLQLLSYCITQPPCNIIRSKDNQEVAARDYHIQHHFSLLTGLVRKSDEKSLLLLAFELKRFKVMCFSIAMV